MTVVILEDAVEDLASGARFSKSCATGVGDYFLDSVLSDFDSLILLAGVHPTTLDPALSQMFSGAGAKAIEVTTLSVDLSPIYVTGNASE